MVVMETAEQEKKILSPTFLKRFFELVEIGCGFGVLVEKKNLFGFKAELTVCFLLSPSFKRLLAVF